MTITDEFIEEILVPIQNFDPPGCAYRDIKYTNRKFRNNSEEREELKANLNKLLQEKTEIKKFLKIQEIT